MSFSSRPGKFFVVSAVDLLLVSAQLNFGSFLGICVYMQQTTQLISSESQVKSQFNNSEHDLRGVVKNLSRLVHKNMIFFLLESLRIFHVISKIFPFFSFFFPFIPLSDPLRCSVVCCFCCRVRKANFSVYEAGRWYRRGEKKAAQKRERVETMSIFSVTLNNWPCVLTLLSV